VHLVDDELLERQVGRGIALPVEGVIDDDALRDDRRIVARVG
jgi:hypothetical protein